MKDEERKEIEWLKNQIEECSSLIQHVSYIENKKEYARDRTWFKLILNLIEKQKKIINEMAYCIDNYQICEYEIQDYNDRKCEYIADDETPPCKECIIEYFTKKVGG